VLVGVNYYEDQQIKDLRYCATDANELSVLLLSQPRYGYATERLNVLTSESPERNQATCRNILRNLIESAEVTTESDLLLFYFAGHGEFIDGEAYLIPSDACNDRLLSYTAVPLRQIKQIMQKAKARAKVVILDACHLGVKLGSRSSLHARQAFLRSALEDAQGIAVLASAAQEELSWEDEDRQHGVFTYCLLEALRGAANANADTYITLNEVANYVRRNVVDWANKHGKTQRPTLDFQGSGEIILLATTSPVTASGEPSSLARVNPIRYTFPMAVKATKDFYNRRKEIEQVKQVLNTTTDIVVVIQGERCAGKTSLLNRVRNMLEEEDWPGQRFLHFWLSPSGAYTVEAFAQEIWHGMRDVLREAGLTTPPEMTAPFQFTTFSSFAHQLERLGAHLPEVRFVAFMDEFDQVPNTIGEMEYKQIIGLMHYIVEQTRFPLLFCISAFRDLPKYYGSPVPQFKLLLPPFSRPDTDEMINGLLDGYASPTDESLKKFHEYTRGNPHFVKALLDRLFELGALGTQAFTLEQLRQAVDLALQMPDTRDILKDIYDEHLNDAERYVLLWLASKEGYSLPKQEMAPSKPEIQSAIRRLCERDYLIQRADGGCHLRIGIIGEWLQTWVQQQLEAERLRVPGIFGKREKVNKLPVGITTHGLCIDLSTQQVYVEGAQISVELSDLQYRALVYLAQNAGRVVSRDELANHLHPDETYISTDQSLDTLIHRLRDALNDRQKPARYLETLRKRGFRLKNTTLARTIFTR
jgi:DNA-binding winged helix-turn-helix (wHTH) protein